MIKRILMIPVYMFIGFSVIVLLGSFHLLTLFKF